MSSFTSPVSNQDISILCGNIKNNYLIDPSDFEKYRVKRGLRNNDGSGVMAGLTRVCSVEGYYIKDGERIPCEGRLVYRGIDIEDIVNGCSASSLAESRAENRYGFEEVSWLLLFGSLPTKEQLEFFRGILARCRELPDDFTEDVIIKTPSRDIMNKLSRAVLGLYSYDENPDDVSVENVLRQSIQLIANIPSLMVYAYQAKRRAFDRQSMYIHPIVTAHSTAECILSSLRYDKVFTDAEAKLLDLCMILHAEHGGGNNSTFAVRTLTSSGTDTYSAIAAGIGSLKGPKHGGANIEVARMVDDMKANISDITDEGLVADYLKKIVMKEAGDRSGLVYGMGHAVYTLSDPRSGILKREAYKLAKGSGCEDELQLLEYIEKLTPEIFLKVKGNKKKISANVDLYSGLVYKMLGIPEDLYTPMFTAARISGWCAHRIEELLTGGRIIRPAYKSLSLPQRYIPLGERTEAVTKEAAGRTYIPIEER